MSQQTINVGATPNDSTGDNLRAAGVKIQANFTELYGTRASVQLTPTAFAALPSPASEGMIASVNNSNTAVWGAIAAGGGANKVLVYYNGANWTVAGK